MLQEILEAIRCREEEIQFLGRAYVVREVDVSQNLNIEDEAEKLALEQGADKKELFYWALVVNSIFVKDGGAPAFTSADIPELRRGARSKLAALLQAVERVNGLSLEDNAKK